MSNVQSYNALIDRFKAFAAGHFILKRFSHGQIEVSDLEKFGEYPFMHVIPSNVTYSQGMKTFSFQIVLADLPRDKEDKTEYQREVLSDLQRIAEDLIAEITNHRVLFGDLITVQNVSLEPFLEEFQHTLTGWTISLDLLVPYYWDACSIPAEWNDYFESSTGGTGSILTFIDSITRDENGNVSLVNDEANPAPHYYYGTNDEGVRGWYLLTDEVGLTCVTLPTCQTIIDIEAAIDLLQEDMLLKANTADISAVGFSNDYNDLDNKPTIPTSLPPTGTAGGDLTGTYPDPTVHRVHGIDLQSGTPSTDDVWVYGGSPAKWQHQHLNASQVDNDSSVTGTTTKLALEHLDSSKQATLVSGTNIKTLEGQSILGSGNIDLTKSDVGLGNVDNTSDLNKPVSTATQTALNAKQDTLVSGTTIKTINSTSLLGSGNVSVEPTITAGTTSQYYRGDKTFQTLDKAAVGLSNVDNTSDANKPISIATQTALNAKQDSLGYTPVPTTRSITINGTTQDLSADRTFTIASNPGTVTSVAALTLGTTGTDLSSTVVNGTSTPVITLNVPTASATNRGALSATDWSTFNSKLSNLTVGTTAIASGGVGRILYQGAGNVLQESSKFSYDETTNSNTRLLFKHGLSQASIIDFSATDTTYSGGFLATGPTFSYATYAANSANLIGGSGGVAIRVNSSSNFAIHGANASVDNATKQFQLFGATGNVLIQNGGTFTDAGFKLDVNGTARIANKLSVGTPSATSALMEITSTTLGFLPPRMTTTQKNAIASPAAGLMVYDTTLNLMSVYNGTTWITL